MRAIVHGLRAENGSLRGLTGQGEPGLWTLLGGTGAEQDAEDLRLAGGAGQVSATSRVARVNGERLVAGVASGDVGSSGGRTPTIPPGFGGRPRPPILA